MNANELRIGNWVNDIKGGGYNNPGFVKVRTIGTNGINIWHDMGASGCAVYEDIRPIPLTPEILEKAGFVETFPNAGIGHWQNKICIGIHKQEYHLLFGDQFMQPNVVIKHLHQIQNLYFALTGEELEVNL